MQAFQISHDVLRLVMAVIHDVVGQHQHNHTRTAVASGPDSRHRDRNRERLSVQRSRRVDELAGEQWEAVTPKRIGSGNLEDGQAVSDCGVRHHQVISVHFGSEIITAIETKGILRRPHPLHPDAGFMQSGPRVVIPDQVDTPTRPFDRRYTQLLSARPQEAGKIGRLRSPTTLHLDRNSGQLTGYLSPVRPAEGQVVTRADAVRKGRLGAQNMRLVRVVRRQQVQSVGLGQHLPIKGNEDVNRVELLGTLSHHPRRHGQRRSIRHEGHLGLRVWSREIENLTDAVDLNTVSVVGHSRKLVRLDHPSEITLDPPVGRRRNTDDVAIEPDLHRRDGTLDSHLDRVGADRQPEKD